ncbi:MAG: hypothetical protein VKM01_04740 [Cyanobacteriota bacterium]|nr:hypothetical protein [Cyanobacteriota bacterium]
MSGPGLDADQLEQLQVFLRDWLRHCGRTQADLRRALRAASIRMPVLIDALHRIYRHEGATGLAGTLCDIEGRWQGDAADDSGLDAGPEDALGQLDLLLAEIRDDLSRS